MKYVMLQIAGGFRFPIIFPDAISHCQLAGVTDGKITSAGFVGMQGQAYGKSTSLKGMKPAPGDEVILVHTLQFNEALLHMVQDPTLPGDTALAELFAVKPTTNAALTELAKKAPVKHTCCSCGEHFVNGVTVCNDCWDHM